MLPLLIAMVGADDLPRVVRAADLLDALARESKLKVEVSKPLAEHRVLLRRKGASSLVAMRQVVRAIGASLMVQDGTYFVRRTEADRRAIRERRARIRGEWIASRLKSVESFRRSGLSKVNSGEAIANALRNDAASWEKFQSGKLSAFPINSSTDLMPSQTLIGGLVRRIGVMRIAGLPSGIHVYEDSPVSSASLLPKHDDLDVAYASSLEELLGGPLARALEEEPSLRSSPVGLKRLPGRPSNVSRLRLECAAYENAVWMNLECYDRSGKVLDRAFLMGSPSGTRLTPAHFLDEAKRSKSRWATLSSDAAAALASLKETAQGLPSWFADPLKDEPLNLFVAETIAAFISEEKAACVAIDVPDAMWNQVRDCAVDGKVNLDAFRSTLDEWLPYERTADVDGVAWRLIDPEAAEARHADRKALRGFARSVVVGQSGDLRSLCRLFHDASRDSSTLPSVWASIARRADSKRSLDEPSERAFAFLGAVSEPDWRSLMTGKTRTVGRLNVSDDLRRLLATEPLAVYGGGRALVPDLYQHPLELFPNDGIGSIPISSEATPEPVFRFWTSDRKPDEQWAPVSEFDRFLRIPTLYFRMQDGQPSLRLTREIYEKRLDAFAFQRGTRNPLKLLIGLPQGYRTSIPLGTSTIPDGKPFAYRDLSQSVRDANWVKAVSQGLAEAKKSIPRGSDGQPN